MAAITAQFSADAAPLLRAIDQINGSIKGLKSAFVGISVGMGALGEAGQLVGAAFGKFRSVVSEGAGLHLLSQTTGESVRNLVILQRAFKNAGLDAAGIQPALRGLARSMGGVNEDGESTNATLRKLGLDLNQLRGASAIEQLSRIGVAIKALPTAAERTAAAMKVLGRSGAELMPLLTSLAGGGAGEAKEQVGGQAEMMQANAESFRAMDRAMNNVAAKGQQFSAGLVRGLLGGGEAAKGATTQLQGMLGTLAKMDVASAGQSLGAVANGGLSIARALAPLAPLIGAVAARAAVAGISAQLAARGFGVMNMSVGALGAKLVTLPAQLAAGSIGFRSLASAGMGAARSILAAFGPVGLAITAATAFFAWKQNQVAHEQSGAQAVSGAVDDAAGQQKENEGMVRGVTSERERTEGLKKLGEQLDAVRVKMQRIDQDHGDLDDEGKSGLAAIYQNQATGLEAMRRHLQAITHETMVGRFEEQRRADAIEASQKAAEELQKRLPTAYADLAAEEKKGKREALKPAEQRQAILGDVGFRTVGGLNTQIGQYEAMNRGAGLGESQQAEYAKLLDAKKAIIPLNKAIAEQEKAGFREIAEEKKRAARADLTPDEHRKALLKEAGHKRERDFDQELGSYQKRDPDSLTAVEHARVEKLLRLRKELLGVDHQIHEEQMRSGEDIAKQLAASQKLAAHEKAFALEMAELRIKLDPRKPAVQRERELRAVDAEKRRDRYTEEGVAAGETKDVAAKRAAQRVTMEDAVTARQRQIEDARNPAGISSLQRIGGATGGGGGNPLLDENRRQTRALERLLSEVQANRRGPSGPAMPPAGGAIFN